MAAYDVAPTQPAERGTTVPRSYQMCQEQWRWQLRVRESSRRGRADRRQGRGHRRRHRPGPAL